jgi:hypothetical protein
VPFTLSHPAIVLPIARRPFVPSALVAGSIAPDLPYYLGLSAWSPFGVPTHAAMGVVTVDVGLAVALLVVFHLLVERPLIELAPDLVRDRVLWAVRSQGRWRPRDLVWTVPSAIVGGASHVLWDAFTHASGPGVEWFPALADPLVGGLAGYKVAQYASGLLGALCIGLWALRWYPGAPLPPHPRSPGLAGRVRAAVFGGLLVLTLVGGVVGATIWLPMHAGGRLSAQALVVNGVVGAVSGAALGLLAYALMWHASDGLSGRSAGAT